MMGRLPPILFCVPFTWELEGIRLTIITVFPVMPVLDTGIYAQRWKWRIKSGHDG